MVHDVLGEGCLHSHGCCKIDIDTADEAEHAAVSQIWRLLHMRRLTAFNVEHVDLLT